MGHPAVGHEASDLRGMLRCPSVAFPNFQQNPHSGSQQQGGCSMVALRGKVVVITGAGGIGSEIARAFADEGCRVAICDRVEDRLESVSERLQGSDGEAFTMIAD